MSYIKLQVVGLKFQPKGQTTKLRLFSQRVTFVLVPEKGRKEQRTKVQSHFFGTYFYKFLLVYTLTHVFLRTTTVDRYYYLFTFYRWRHQETQRMKWQSHRVNTWQSQDLDPCRLAPATTLLSTVYYCHAKNFLRVNYTKTKLLTFHQITKLYTWINYEKTRSAFLSMHSRLLYRRTEYIPSD